MLTASSAISLPDEVTSLLRPLASIPAPGKPTRGIDPRAARFGGKAAALADLARDGYPVPPGWVLDATYFRRFIDEHLPKGHDVSSLIKNADTRIGMDRAARARDRILSDPLPAELASALERLYDAVAPEAPWGLSVRSSATVEDARGSSLAGLATTILGVRGPAHLLDAVRQVWASLYLPRTLIYLSRWGVREVAMPILIMPMVRAAAAGVLFTGPPHGLEGDRWKRDERVVHATFGLGAPVVDGASASDTFRLSAQGALIDSVIAAKTTELVVDETGLVARRIEPERQSMPSLAASTISELGALAKRLTATQPA